MIRTARARARSAMSHVVGIPAAGVRERFRTSDPYRVKAGVGHLALRESRFFLRIGSPREPQKTPENPSRLGNHLGNI